MCACVCVSSRLINQVKLNKRASKRVWERERERVSKAGKGKQINLCLATLLSLYGNFFLAALPPSVFSMISRNNKWRWRWRSRWRCCRWLLLLLLTFSTTILNSCTTHIRTHTQIHSYVRCITHFKLKTFFRSLLFSSFFVSLLLLYCLIFHSARWRCVANKKSYDTAPSPCTSSPFILALFTFNFGF